MHAGDRPTRSRTPRRTKHGDLIPPHQMSRRARRSPRSYRPHHRYCALPRRGRGADDVRLPEGRAPEHAGVGPPVGGGQIADLRRPAVGGPTGGRPAGWHRLRQAVERCREPRGIETVRAADALHASRLGHATICRRRKDARADGGDPGSPAAAAGDAAYRERDQRIPPGADRGESIAPLSTIVISCARSSRSVSLSTFASGRRRNVASYEVSASMSRWPVTRAPATLQSPAWWYLCRARWW